MENNMASKLQSALSVLTLILTVSVDWAHGQPKGSKQNGIQKEQCQQVRP
jgi:hypothetical protein